MSELAGATSGWHQRGKFLEMLYMYNLCACNLFMDHASKYILVKYELCTILSIGVWSEFAYNWFLKEGGGVGDYE